MSVYKNYNLTFFNRVVNNRVIKTVGGMNTSSVLFSPLSYYLYYIDDAETIDEILVDINNVLNEQTFYNGIEVGTERIELTKTTTTITSSDGTIQSLPTSDLKAILLEYRDFLNTPPLNGSKV